MSADVQTSGTGWEPVPWDSAFFGTPIGRIDLADGDRTRVTAAEDEARAAGIRCLYAELDGADAPLAARAQRWGYHLVEIALDLTHATSTLPPGPTGAANEARTREATHEDLAAMTAQFEAVAPWSRFAVDLRFGLPAAIALHRAAAERAVAGVGGRRLLVAEDAAGDIVGFSTIAVGDPGDQQGSPPGSHRRIEVIATTRRGTAAPIALVRHAFTCFGPGPSVGGTIAARNVVSLRFSEGLGYRIGRATYHLHRWLDEPVAHPEDLLP